MSPKDGKTHISKTNRKKSFDPQIKFNSNSQRQVPQRPQQPVTLRCCYPVGPAVPAPPKCSSK